MNKNNKATNKAKLYVVQTYTSWTEPKYKTNVVDVEGLLKVQKQADEVITIHELGKEVKLKMELV